MSPSHKQAGPGPLPALGLQNPPSPHVDAPAARGWSVTDCAPHALRGHGLVARRVIRRSVDDVFASLVDPSALLVLHAGGSVLAIDSAPWTLGSGDTVEFRVRRWGMTLHATLTVVAATPGRAVTWRVDYRRGRRLVHAGEIWTARLDRHPHGTWLDLTCDDTPLTGALFGLRGRQELQLRQGMAIGLREFDLLLTRHDQPVTH